MTIKQACVNHQKTHTSGAPDISMAGSDACRDVSPAAEQSAASSPFNKGIGFYST